MWITSVLWLFSIASAHSMRFGIPDNWETYIDPEMITNYEGKGYQASYSTKNFQGDILGIDKNLPSDQLRAGLNNVVDSQEKRWPNGTVPYTIGDSFLDLDREMEKYRIELAMELIGSTSSYCIRFVPRSNEKDYVKIVRGLSCDSSVGRQGGPQTVSLTRGCLENIGSIQHELLHALGFYHEISRSDRDEYIWINWDNILEAFHMDFAIPTDAMTFGCPYDYESVMHYPYNAFAINDSKPTIVPKQKGKRIGQNIGLSMWDIVKIRKAYNCPGADKIELFIPTASSSTSQERTTPTTISPSGIGCCPRKFDYCGSMLVFRGCPADSVNQHHLYLCSGPGAIPNFKSDCENGCQDGGTGKDDFCASQPQLGPKRSSSRDFVDTTFGLIPVAQGKDYHPGVENDLFDLRNVTFEKCIAECSETENCDIVVIKHEGRMCFGKSYSGPSEFREDDCCDVYNIGRAKDPQFSIIPVVHQMDYMNGVDNEFFTIASISIQECRKKCLATPKCQIVIMIHDLKLCIGKGWKGFKGFKRTQYDTDVHFVAKFNGESKLNFLPSGTVDYNPGQDVFVEDLKSVAGCSEHCFNTTGCDLILVNNRYQHCFGKKWSGIEGFAANDFADASDAHIFTANGTLLY